MRCTEIKINSYRRHGRGSFATPLCAAFLTTLSAILLAGCSLTDAPPASLAPEQNVRNYYILVAAPGMHYDYAITSDSSFLPASVMLGMDMQGVDDTVSNIPVYSCLWTYQNYGTPTEWNYGLTDSVAINFGVEISSGNYSDSWVDLQAPLEDSATWTFMSQGEKISATVVKYGVSAQVEEKTYSDVIMVQYTGAKGTTGTEWFARGTGIIFSKIIRPGWGSVENQLQDVVQK